MARQYQQWANAHGEFNQSVDAGRLTMSPKIPDARHVYVPRISLTLGEIAYHVRSTLDYLVFSIAGYCNKGRPVSGTQFPLEDCEARYWMRWTGTDPRTGREVAKWLNKIPKEVALDFAHYQPFAGCKWAALLRDISNPDKHRHLTTLDSEATFIPSRPPLGVIDTHTGSQSVHLHGGIEVGVSLKTGEDVLDASKLAESEARALVRSYAGRFHLSPRRFV